MKEKSIKLLNGVVADELSAVHQYMYFHFHCDDQGYDLLAALFKKTSIDEMIHVEVAAERILFLGGDVEMKPAHEVQKITDVREMLVKARQMEEESIAEYNEWANLASENRDAATRKVFEELVADEERHFDQFDQEIANLDRFGEKYLVLQSIERSKAISAGGEE
ncbi:MAG: bacterioferritin [Gemmatimonadetes bacterium]|nr:bacterioferritin [Gemmatimonadota bacterium]NNK48474.1 bacterioferritin [Gemmatimonadota bacterium]